MRFGIYVDTKQVNLLNKVDCDFAEIGMDALAKMSGNEFDEFLKENENSDIKVEFTNRMVPGNISIMGSRLDEQYLIDYINHIFSRASKLGVKTCILGSGKSRSYEKGYTLLEGIEQFKHVLAIVSDIAKKYDIIVETFPLSYGETNMINTVKEANDFVNSLNKDNIKLIADFYHMRNNDEDFNILRDACDNLVHVHVAGFTEKRKFPINEDEDNYREFFDILKEINYDKTISVEANIIDLLGEAKIGMPMLRGL